MKRPYSDSAQGPDSILTSLGLRHTEDARNYRAAATQLNDGDDKNKLVRFLNVLSEYREQLRTEVNQIIADMSGGVHTPSKQGNSYLESHGDDWTQAVNTNNRVKIAEMIYQSEQETGDYYSEAQNSPGIEDRSDIKELLERQHGIVLDHIRQADRFQRVPQLED
ncbi:MAG: hypothetical protein WBA17_06875 [Saprospiraceae bacterium]